MDDIILRATLDDSRTIFISPIDRDTYAEHVDDDNLGGEDGYFLLMAHAVGYPRLEVLAKLPTLEAARAVFDLIACGQTDSDEARRAYYAFAPTFS